MSAGITCETPDERPVLEIRGGMWRVQICQADARRLASSPRPARGLALDGGPERGLVRTIARTAGGELAVDDDTGDAPDAMLLRP